MTTRAVLALGASAVILLAAATPASAAPIRFAVLAHDPQADGWNNRLFLFTKGAHERHGDQVVAFPLNGEQGAYAKAMKSPKSALSVWQLTPGAGYGIGRKVVHSVHRTLRVSGKAQAKGSVEWEGQGIGLTQHFTFRASDKKQGGQLASLLPASVGGGGGGARTFYCKALPTKS